MDENSQVKCTREMKEKKIHLSGFQKVGISPDLRIFWKYPSRVLKCSNEEWAGRDDERNGEGRRAADGGSRGVYFLDTPGWKGRLSTAGSPWPRSDRGEVFLIFVGFLLPCQQAVCLLSHSVTVPGFGGLEAGSTSHAQQACFRSHYSWSSDICSTWQKSDC